MCRYAGLCYAGLRYAECRVFYCYGECYIATNSDRMVLVSRSLNIDQVLLKL
jgi:hypothetical protein